MAALSYLAITLLSSSGPKCTFFGRELHTVGDKSKRSSVRASSIMSVLSSDSGLVMPTVYEATWPSATKLWTYTEQRKNSDFANLFLTLLFTNDRSLTHVVLEFLQMEIF